MAPHTIPSSDLQLPNDEGDVKRYQQDVILVVGLRNWNNGQSLIQYTQGISRRQDLVDLRLRTLGCEQRNLK